MSILVLFLLLGVATPKHISYHDNDDIDEPIITREQESRICAELCMAGLGGAPCGDGCVDMLPQGLPRRSNAQSLINDDTGENLKSFNRESACPVLCANKLGYPLCSCNKTNDYNPFFRVNYVQICAHYCIAYQYQIFGCKKCDSFLLSNGTETISRFIASKDDGAVDWNAWCRQMCKEGDGGAACYCDLLPMGLQIPSTRYKDQPLPERERTLS